MRNWFRDRRRRRQLNRLVACDFCCDVRHVDDTGVVSANEILPGGAGIVTQRRRYCNDPACVRLAFAWKAYEEAQ